LFGAAADARDFCAGSGFAGDIAMNAGLDSSGAEGLAVLEEFIGVFWTPNAEVGSGGDA
jgi:hypothetical protein